MDGPRVQPSLIVAVNILVGWGIDFTFDPPGIPPDIKAAGAPVILLGIGLLAWAIITQVKAGNNPEIHHPTHQLVVTGPYKFTRNPIYLGFLIAQIGIGLTLAWPIAAMTPVSGYLLHRFVVVAEEKQLASVFSQYPEYCRRTRRWL